METNNKEYLTMTEGDIVLVAGKKLLSKSLITMQKAINKESKYSHVAICIGTGLFIHAVNKKGVQIVTLNELFDDSIEDNWIVIRNNNIASQNNVIIFQKSHYYVHQKYKFDFKSDEKYNQSFCSELVVKLIREYDKDFFKQKSSKYIYPIHFQELVNISNEWDYATNIYKDILYNDKFKSVKESIDIHSEFIKSQSYSIIEHLKFANITQNGLKVLGINIGSQVDTNYNINTFYNEENLYEKGIKDLNKSNKS